MTPFHHGFMRFINKYSFRKALIAYETEDMMKYDCASPDIGRKKLIFQLGIIVKLSVILVKRSKILASSVRRMTNEWRSVLSIVLKSFRFSCKIVIESAVKGEKPR